MLKTRLLGQAKKMAAMFLGCVATIAAASIPARAETVWDLYIYHPTTVVIAAQGVVKMVEEIEKQTKGELKIKLHLGGSLQINVSNMTQAVADNVIQMGDDGFFAGNIPMAGLVRLPFLMSSDENFDKGLEIIRPTVEATYKKKGVVLLGTYRYQAQMPFSRKPLTSLADFKGQKLRVTSPEQGEFIRKFGGTSVTMGTPEVPAAIDRGVIEGALTAASGSGFTWRDLVKYNYRLGVTYVESYIIANQEAFEKLSAENQAIVRKVVGDTTPWMNETMRSEDENYVKRMVAENGLIVTQPKPEEVAESRKAMEPYWDSWAKSRGGDAPQLLAKIKAAVLP